MNGRLLFIGYWGLHDSLTVSTILPRLEVLQRFPFIKQIVLVTIEREPATDQASPVSHLSKVRHMPLFSKKLFANVATKINDFVLFPSQSVRLAHAYNPGVILAHGAPAGALAHKVFQKTKIPYLVSSFEPHAAYMLESGVWHKYGPKYRFQKHWESLQKKYAAGLMPVSEGYKRLLVQGGVAAEKVVVVPCTVDTGQFAFDVQKRAAIRLQLGWKDALIGIYAGKYGGLYYEDEAFAIYRKCFELMPGFRLLILSPQPQEEIMQLLNKHALDSSKVHMATVQHQKVPDYLSAADFAFATYKPGASKRYLSPIKIGEYWASGLPVLLTEGIGDDSDIMKNEGGGATFNLSIKNNLEEALQKIQAILQNPQHRQQITKLATKYRSPDKIREAYEFFFTKLKEVQP